MPPTPITAETYAKYGYPFFKIYEEPSDISANWVKLQSIGDTDKKKGNSSVHEAEASLSFPSTTLNTLTDAEQIDEDELDEDVDSEKHEYKDEDKEYGRGYCMQYKHSSSVVQLNNVDKKSAFLPIRLLEDQLYK